MIGVSFRLRHGCLLSHRVAFLGSEEGKGLPTIERRGVTSESGSQLAAAAHVHFVPPSMSAAVKSRQPFFRAARPAPAAGLVPLRRRLPALFPSVLSPPPPALTRGEGRAAAGTERSSASPLRGMLGRRAVSPAL